MAYHRQAPASAVMQLLADRIPLSLLCDLVDPDGMRTGLAGELLAGDVVRAPAPPRPVGHRLTA